MLFDLKPKEKVSDFFNYKDELMALRSFLIDKTTRMVVVRGLRRTGKSSLTRVALNVTGSKFVLIDARELSSLSRRSFESKLLEELKSFKGLPASLLERIESVEFGIRVILKNEQTLWKVLKSLNPIIVVDEVQMLQGTGVEAFFAALYDNTDCKIVLTGSEIGVLDSFVGKDNPKAPLFGRAFKEIKMHPLSSDKSKDFLVSGFKSSGKMISGTEVNRAVEVLDGIVGWLTIFGNSALLVDIPTALNESVRKGALLAYSELTSFLQNRAAAKNRYLTIMHLLAQKEMRWSTLKDAVQFERKEIISDSQFSTYLNSLVMYGFVTSLDQHYSIPDPLLKRALIEGTNVV